MAQYNLKEEIINFTNVLTECQSRKNHKEQISIVKDTVHKKFLEFPLKETQGIFLIFLTLATLFVIK